MGASGGGGAAPTHAKISAQRTTSAGTWCHSRALVASTTGRCGRASPRKAGTHSAPSCGRGGARRGEGRARRWRRGAARHGAARRGAPDCLIARGAACCRRAHQQLAAWFVFGKRRSGRVGEVRSAAAATSRANASRPESSLPRMAAARRRFHSTALASAVAIAGCGRGAGGAVGGRGGTGNDGGRAAEEEGGGARETTTENRDARE